MDGVLALSGERQAGEATSAGRETGAERTNNGLQYLQTHRTHSHHLPWDLRQTGKDTLTDRAGQVNLGIGSCPQTQTWTSGREKQLLNVLKGTAKPSAPELRRGVQGDQAASRQQGSERECHKI